MNRLIVSLLLLLLLQGAIAAALYWPHPGVPDEGKPAPLLQLADTSVSSIEVSDNSGAQTLLQRQGERWILPELQGLPADPQRVQQLLAALTAADHGWPVADTPSARQRFQVADYLYQRQVKLLAGEGKLGTIYLGTAPGFRRVYARNADHSAIYSIALNNHDVPASADDWLDPRLLQTRAPLAIAADGYSLSRQDGDWRLGQGGAPDPRELEALLSALRSLQVQGIASEDEQRELATAEAELVLQIESLAGKATLELFQLEDGYFILSSEFPFFFRLGGYDFDRLTGIDAFILSAADAGSEP